MSTQTIPVNDQFELTEFRASDRERCSDLLNNERIYEMTLQIPFPYRPELHFLNKSPN